MFVGLAIFNSLTCPKLFLYLFYLYQESPKTGNVNRESDGVVVYQTLPCVHSHYNANDSP